jgi:Ca2+-binding EF-hand superfamily protein
LFARLDADGDKMLSAGETPDGFARLVRRSDRDGDGQLSLKEFQQMARRAAQAQQAQQAPADSAALRRSVRQLLIRFDRNGDGSLAADEAPPRLRNRFDRLDQDGDGLLAGDELSRAAAAMARIQRGGEGRQFRPTPGE